MEESLMTMTTLRHLILEQRLIDYLCTNEPDKIPRSFDCGPEFGAAYLYYKGGSWHIEWGLDTKHVFVEQCPVDLDDLPKQGE